MTSLQNSSIALIPSTLVQKPQSPQQMKQPKTKKVSFSRNVRCWPIRHLNNFTEQEIVDCWHTDSERIQIRQDAMSLCAPIKTKEQPRDESLRGLEFQTKQGKELRKIRRRIAYNAVMKEQDRQIQENVWDDAKLAAVYSKVTLFSKVQAFMMGLSDYRESLNDSSLSSSSSSSGRNATATTSTTVHKSESDLTLLKKSSSSSHRCKLPCNKSVNNWTSHRHPSSTTSNTSRSQHHLALLFNHNKLRKKLTGGTRLYSISV